MEIKPAGKIPYTKKTWDDYKDRLASTLRKRALDGDQIFKDNKAKEFIVNYMQNELINEKKETERLILNMNIRLVHMEIESTAGKRVFPVVNEYKGHHLMNTYYFHKKKDGSIVMESVEVNPKPLILGL
jgi:hypothetical protein